MSQAGLVRRLLETLRDSLLRNDPKGWTGLGCPFPCPLLLPQQGFCPLTSTSLRITYAFPWLRSIARRCFGGFFVGTFTPLAVLPGAFWRPASLHRADLASEGSGSRSEFPQMPRVGEATGRPSRPCGCLQACAAGCVFVSRALHVEHSGLAVPSPAGPLASFAQRPWEWD